MVNEWEFMEPRDRKWVNPKPIAIFFAQHLSLLSCDFILSYTLMVDDRSGRLATQIKPEPTHNRNGSNMIVEAIDDWLEDDLIQRGILDSTTENNTSPVSQTIPDMVSETSSSNDDSSVQYSASRKRSKGGADASTKDIAIKRQRNTDAARRSRLRKALKLQSLEHEVTELKSENKALAGQVSTLEARQVEFASREKSLKGRIQELERQLRETKTRLKQAQQGHI